MLLDRLEEIPLQCVSSCLNLESAFRGENPPEVRSKMDLITTNKNEQSTVSIKDTALCFGSDRVKKSERLAFRLSAADYSELKKLAADSNLPISVWLRDATLKNINQQKNSLVA